jgi:hypothetical protein
VSVTKNGVALVADTSNPPSAAKYYAATPNVVVFGTQITSTDSVYINYYTDEITDTYISDKILIGANRINNLLNCLYSVPFSTVSSAYPPDIVMANAYIASAIILERLYIGEVKNTTALKNEYIAEAREILEPLISGQITLTNVDGTLVVKTDMVSSTTTDEHPIFNMGEDQTWGKDFVQNTFDEE